MFTFGSSISFVEYELRYGPALEWLVVTGLSWLYFRFSHIIDKRLPKLKMDHRSQTWKSAYPTTQPNNYQWVVDHLY